MIKALWFETIENVLVYHAWLNDRNNFYNKKFSEVFEEQKTNQNITLNQGDKLIINCCNEGIGPKDLEQVMEVLKPYDVRVFFNSYITENLPYKYEVFVDHFSSHCGFVGYNQRLNIDWENLIPTKSFISLNRRASEGRCRLAKKILDNFDHKTFLLSCGSQPDPYLQFRNKLKDIMHPYKLPILLDGEIDGMDEQHNHNNVDWFTCFINVVTESSSQTDKESWHEIFITEKSLKAFLYRQLPIFWAVPGTVQLLRDMGFDLYDDVIDHSYDTIQDSDIRLDTVINEIKRMTTKYNLDQMHDLRKQLWLRINKNVDLLVQMNRQHPLKFRNKMMELIK